MDLLIDANSTCASNWINSTITHDSNDTKVILHTVKVYGLVFVISLVSFCCLRQWFPRVYNIRNWVEKYQTPLAADQRGWVSWMWQLFHITEKELRDECGMDALCYSRIFTFGIKMSAMGALHAIWLMPVYGTVSLSPLIKVGDDPIATVSITNVPSGSSRFIGTVVASYCIFFYCMHLMLQELKWFTRARHEFLTKLLPRNYTVYVQSVPEDLRNNNALREFFQEGLAANTVLNAQLGVTVANLKVLQKKRRKLLDKLQLLIDQNTTFGNANSNDRTISSPRSGDDRNSDEEIDSLYRELEEMNRVVEMHIDGIEERANVYTQEPYRTGDTHSQEGTCLLDEDDTENVLPTDGISSGKAKTVCDKEGVQSSNDIHETSHHSALDIVTDTLIDAANTVEEWTEQVVRETGRVVVDLVSSVDGQTLPSAFVTFTTLRGTHSALQMVQYPEFYAMKVSEAPQPEDIIWSNVGRPHQELKIFSLLSLALTVSVCLLWTVPMAFISSIANLHGLRAQFHWLNELLTHYPRLEIFFNQLAPLLIVLAGQVMYLIAEIFTVFEGPISGAIVQTRMFVKLYWFQIIQTFFISAISGSVFSVLSDLIATPSCIVQLLASSLPGQSSFFIQLVLVHTFAGMSTELLRPVPVILALLRLCLGPRSSDRERQKTFLFLRPLSDPVDFYQCNRLSITVLYFMILSVYTAIAPISNFFILGCFLIQKSCILHQFVYIYPPFPDSGGKLWMEFFAFVPWGMIISQVTIIGMLSLKRANKASLSMIPLFACTVLFWYYVRQEHFQLADLLSAKECNLSDLKHAQEGVDWSFLRGRYIQPELLERRVTPEYRDRNRLTQSVSLDAFASARSTAPTSEDSENP